MEILGGGTLLNDLSHWGRVLRMYGLIALPALILCFCGQMKHSFPFVAAMLHGAFPTITGSFLLNPFFFKLLLIVVFTATEK